MTTKPILILHYADWCGHCVMFKPTWKKIVTALVKNKDIHVVEVESANAHFIEKYTKDVRSYPTVRILKKGKFTEFSGMRGFAEVVAFAKSHIDKPKAAVAPKKELKTKV